MDQKLQYSNTHVLRYPISFSESALRGLESEFIGNLLGPAML